MIESTIKNYNIDQGIDELKDIIDQGIKNTIIITEYHDCININHVKIRKKNDKWKVKKHLFFYKKNAVGYVIHNIKREYNEARTLMYLDHRISHIIENIEWYEHTKKKANETLKIAIDARLSDEICKLNEYMDNVNKNLRSISLEIDVEQK